MRFVVISDTHGDVITHGVERRSESAHAFDVAIELCRQSPLDTTFIHLGDCANPYSRGVHRAMGDVLHCAAELNAMNVANIWLTGNHDVIESSELDHTLIGLKRVNLKMTTVFDKPGCWSHGSYVFIALPYTSFANNYDPSEMLKSMLADLDPNVQVLIGGHLMIEGIGPGSESSDMARGRDLFFPIDTCRELCPKAFLMNGHYHERQQFRGIHIPGSPVRFTHGEESNDTGIMVIDG